MKAKQEILWKERYPSITMHVKNLETISTKKKKLDWLENHTYVVLTDVLGARFEGVIHNGLLGLLQAGRKFTLWYGHPDFRFDRYVEIFCVQAIDE